MKKIIKVSLIIVGVIVVVLGGFVGFKIYDVQQQKGVNILTGELTAEGKALVDANSKAPNVELNVADMFSEKDLIQVPDINDSVVLNLEDGKDIVVDKEGVFVISGDYKDAMIIVEVDKTEKVQLVFDGVSIVNEDKPVVYVKSGDKVFVTTTDSKNDISVTGEYKADGETKLDAVVFSKTDVVFNGIGTLDINSETGNGISSKDVLKITGGTYNIVALKDGLEANDSIRIYDGEISINSSNDAMHSENNEDESLGYVFIEGGLINIVASDDAIRGNSAVLINGGTINIDSCQEGLEASQIIINDGEVTIYSTDDGINATFKTSYRAVIEVNGGIVNVAMADGDTDGFDSNGDFTINGGIINVEGGMAAFDVDGTIAFNAGDVMVDGVKQTEIKVQQVGILSKFKSN
ncbi:carbohydrate-binding domain-containing protein [Clostridium grantii]|uniref:Carbohydrate-binding domain-containing protein n=1 Tax=Clostridium grantii DSM 8605 TaxID=1121316 RepID=A0A1M5Y2B1_9CLOT|nr:carbohydrate-binding domain-containing protein [Clostridium grantii]SHI06211.1 protein of unknown function [Clostridium grantii DSM 8605]